MDVGLLSWPSFGRYVIAATTAALPHVLFVIGSFNVQSCKTSNSSTTPHQHSPPSPPRVINASVNFNDWRNARSVYDFTVKSIDGELVPLERYRGNVLLIINIASKEGITYLTQWTFSQLVQLHHKYFDKGLRILAFPCNQFRNMTPHSNSEIIKFTERFQVTFDLFDKIDVNGKNTSPLWKYLKQKVSGTFGRSIKWNYTKYIINRKGIPVKRCGPVTLPFTAESILLRYLCEKVTPTNNSSTTQLVV